nr:hypothetical transcript [Hymenolepis microstoma]
MDSLKSHDLSTLRLLDEGVESPTTAYHQASALKDLRVHQPSQGSVFLPLKPVFERCSARSGNQKALFQGAATSMEEKTPVHEETEIFATPTQPAPRRATRPSTRRTSRRGIDNSTTDRTTSFSSSSSQSLSRSNVSPLFMSPLTRLEAAVNALESTEEEKKKLTLNQGDFCPSRQLYDPNVSYLLDQSPSVLSQEHQTKTPPPGGLIVPAFGSRHYNITSKSVFSARAEDETTLHPLQPKATQTMTTDSAKTVNKGNCRRFFTSTFAERNKREVERHFLEMVGELSDPSTLKPGGRQLKSGKKVGDAGVAKRQVKNQKKPKRQTKKTKSKIKLSFLEDTQTDNNSDVDSVPRSSENDAGGPDESACKFRSRPAIRQAAKVARSKITKTSLIQDQDDQLMIGLSRFGKETVATKVETIKKPPGGGTGIVDLDDGVELVFSFGLADEMSQCINNFYSTLRLTESDFKTRISQLKEQVDKMRRLLQWSQRSQTKDRKAQNSIPLW